MIDQFAANSKYSAKTYGDADMCSNDRQVLRDLAVKVAEIASQPVQEEKRKLWYRHNSLQATRPLVFCDPETGWREIITERQLLCKNVLAREWEIELRKNIFWGTSMGDDRVVEPFFDVPYCFNTASWGIHADKKYTDESIGSFTWEAPLKNYDEMSKLHFPKIEIDYIKTEEIFTIANEIFGGLLKVRKKNSWWWSLGLTLTAAHLRGLQQIMLDMYDYPDEFHRLMAFLRDGFISMIEYLEKNNLLSLNNDGTYVGSGGFGYTDELPKRDFDGINVRTIDMWGFSESQETGMVSPEMFEEFVFPYQLPILERFGLNCYGCCEALNKRWQIVKRIPGLRRVSVSPWADIKDMAEKLGNKYIFSMKPNPAYLAVSNLDEEFIRKSLRESMKSTKNCCVEVIMKDNTTIGNNPENVIKWSKIAREEAESV